MSIKTKTIPALEARTQLGQIMKDVHGGRVRVLVEKSGIPMVAIISADEFRRVIAEREARFEVVDRIRRRLPSVSDVEVRQDVRAVLKQVRRRLRLAAAKRDLTVRQYVLDAIEERLREDLGDEDEGMSALTRKADPVLAELWDNRKDSAYDRL